MAAHIWKFWNLIRHQINNSIKDIVSHIKRPAMSFFVDVFRENLWKQNAFYFKIKAYLNGTYSYLWRISPV